MSLLYAGHHDHPLRVIIIIDLISDIGGQGDKSVPYAKRPCVGLCYILKMKTRGIKVIPRSMSGCVNGALC